MNIIYGKKNNFEKKNPIIIIKLLLYIYIILYVYYICTMVGPSCGVLWSLVSGSCDLVAWSLVFWGLVILWSLVLGSFDVAFLVSPAAYSIQYTSIYYTSESELAHVC